MVAYEPEYLPWRVFELLLLIWLYIGVVWVPFGALSRHQIAIKVRLNGEIRVLGGFWGFLR